MDGPNPVQKEFHMLKSCFNVQPSKMKWLSKWQLASPATGDLKSGFEVMTWALLRTEWSHSLLNEFRRGQRQQSNPKLDHLENEYSTLH